MSEIVEHYLAEHPLDVVRVLETSRTTDVKTFIDSLALDEQVVVFSHLLPHTAATYLDTARPCDAAAVVARLNTNIAARIVGTLRRTVLRPILDELPVDKRENIEHLLRYPAESVGSLMLTNTLACRDDATVRRAKQLVRRFLHTELPMMVVVDSEMRPVGLVSLNTLIGVREREYVRDHMRFVPGRLRAFADVSTVLRMPIWNTEDYVPVVDATEHYVGLLPKARLHDYALSDASTASTSDELASTILNIADMVWKPAVMMLTRASTQRSEIDDE
ncbi:MAG: magnesium transporter [Gammaproteobacteria bacterium]